MAYDEDLANRVREILGAERGLVEKKMFGGLAFLIGGHMSVSVSGRGGLLLRCGHENTEALRAKPGAGPFEMRGKAMDGWLRVEPEAVKTKRQLERWVERGVDYARSLPPKVDTSIHSGSLPPKRMRRSTSGVVRTGTCAGPRVAQLRTPAIAPAPTPKP
jgi:hypothetical protein